MKYLLVVLIIGIASFYVEGESDSLPPPVEFRSHFQALSTKRYPFYENGEHWKEARYYIASKMRHYGARVLYEQEFNTTVDGQPVTGVNLIGITEGDPNGNGSVVVVGADYDSNLLGNQLKNNAGGVACLLETMHLFYDKDYWNQYYLNFTVIFVAFDLNTREYHQKENGHPGSYYFIHEWLLDYLGNDTSVRDFRGAIILDSVTTYNADNDTQSLRAGFEDAMPKAYEEIRADGNKGNFLGLLYNSKDGNNPLVSTFVDEYNKNATEKPFRLQEMEIHLGLSLVLDEMLGMINHQSQYMFWANFKGRHLPAFLLFDTDDDREDPTPKACSEINCNVDEFLTDERIDFMTQTTQALFRTLIRLQASHFDQFPEYPDEEDSATILKHSTSFTLLTISVTFALARLLRS